MIEDDRRRRRGWFGRRAPAVWWRRRRLGHASYCDCGSCLGDGNESQWRRLPQLTDNARYIEDQ